MVYNHESRTFWDLKELQELTKANDWDAAHERVHVKRRALGYKSSDLETIISLFVDDDFHGKYPQMNAGVFGFLNADAYKLHYNPDDKCRCSAGEGEGDYIFMKLSKYTNEDGCLCAIISFHLESAP